MKYILCEFTEGYSGNFYQEIDSLGNVSRVLDLEGNVLNLPNGGEPDYIPYSAIVIDPNPETPIWAN